MFIKESAHFRFVRPNVFILIEELKRPSGRGRGEREKKRRREEKHSRVEFIGSGGALAVGGGENCGEIHFGIGREREREGGGLSRGGAAGDVTLIDEPFSVFSPIRKRGRREGEGGIDALLGCSLPFPGY